jgi:putative transposase
MAIKIEYQLTDEEVEILEQAIRHDERAAVRQRATAIRMLHLGKHPSEVAQVLAVSVPTLYNWHARWRKAGLEGLANRPKSGRPRKASEEYCRVLEETMAKEPPELGYAFTVWTVQRLREHLKKETGIDLSASRLRILLKEKNYRYRRPKHDLHHLQDQSAKEQARELLEELKKGSAETISGSSLWTKQP